MVQPPTLYVHILVAASSTAKADKENASFFFSLSVLGLIDLFLKGDG
jgi:hypothetical protein